MKEDDATARFDIRRQALGFRSHIQFQSDSERDVRQYGPAADEIWSELTWATASPAFYPHEEEQKLRLRWTS